MIASSEKKKITKYIIFYTFTEYLQAIYRCHVFYAYNIII